MLAQYGLLIVVVAVFLFSQVLGSIIFDVARFLVGI
jgi:hypothetical protein